MSFVSRQSVAAIAPRDSTTSRHRGAFAWSVQRSPCAATGITPAFISSVSSLPPSPIERQTCAVPSVGCPANGISKVGVKIRTRALALLEGRMNVVSDRLNCRASACIVSIIEGGPVLEYAQRIAREHFRASREDVQQPVGMIRHDLRTPQPATAISVPQKPR